MPSNFRALMLLPIMLSSLSLTACQTIMPIQSKPTLQQPVNQTVIVMFAPNMDKSQLLQAIKPYQGRVLYDYKNLNGLAITFPSGTDMAQVMATLRSIPGVKTVEKDSIQTIQ